MRRLRQVERGRGRQLRLKSSGGGRHGLGLLLVLGHRRHSDGRRHRRVELLVAKVELDRVRGEQGRSLKMEKSTASIVNSMFYTNIIID